MPHEKPSADQGREASAGLSVIEDFINTLHMDGHGGRDESLASSHDLKRWLVEHKLLPPGAATSDADLAQALALREALRDLLSANEGVKAPQTAVDTLSRAARSAQLVVSFERDGHASLRPAAGGVDAAFGTLLALTFQSITDGSWQRLKACHDPLCRWAFYDRSKNRSGSWCSMASCGNRAKARRFRRTHAPAS